MQQDRFQTGLKIEQDKIVKKATASQFWLLIQQDKFQDSCTDLIPFQTKSVKKAS